MSQGYGAGERVESDKVKSFLWNGRKWFLEKSEIPGEQWETTGYFFCRNFTREALDQRD